jgi:hypothetical protein
MRAILPRAVVLVERHWRLTGDFPLDQGAVGACVGFGRSPELSAEPVALPTGSPFAQRLYGLAQAEDRAMGHDYGSGVTVLAGLKAAKKLGLIQGYRWARSFDDIRDAVVAHGSVVMGTNWYSLMDAWTNDGLVEVGGYVRGGHCWTIVGYIPDHPKWGEVFAAVNSWGTGWGLVGRFYMRADDVRRLLAEKGEAAIVTDTPQAPTPPPPPAPARRWPRIPAWFRAWLASVGVVEGR